MGSTYHSINVERRRLAWTRINPSLKPLAEEKYDKQEGNLFGPTFLEKASKKLEADKALAKVFYNPQSSQSSRKHSFEEDPSDLRCFLSKGAPAQYGSKGKQRLQKPYSQPEKQFHHQKSFNQSKKARTNKYQSRQ